MDRHAFGAHLWGLVVGSNFLVRGDEILLLIAGLQREDLLDASIEEEGDVGVLLSLGHVHLLDLLLAQPLSQDVAHVLRLESNFEGVIRLVLGHRDQLDLGVGEIGQGGSVDITKELGDLTGSVGAVVEEEYNIVIFAGLEFIR